MTDARRLPHGRFTPAQAQVLAEAGRRGLSNPSFLSDLEGSGPVSTLEEALRTVVGKQYVLALSSCTAAIHATLLALGIGPGDEVIVTPYSWGQSVAPVLFTGATAVFADIDATTLCLDPISVQERISPRTRAILPVHLFGRLTDLMPLRQLADAHGLALVVDGAHALGCRPAAGQEMAAWGDVACFSLGRGKLICGGEGGFLVTDKADLYEKALLLTQHASRVIRELGPQHGQCGELGFNYRMHPLAAVLALTDLAEMENRLAHRRSVWQAFHEGMGPHSELAPVAPDTMETWSAYGIPLTLNIQQTDNSSRRGRLLATANDAGLPLRSGPISTPLHLRLASHPFPVIPHPTQAFGSCPVAERRCESQELWMLSALDMDGITTAESHALGSNLRIIFQHTIHHHDKRHG